MLKRIILVILFGFSLTLAETISQEEIQAAITNHYATQFDVNPSDVHISMLHSFKPRTFQEPVTLLVDPTNSLPDVGYQTVWVEFRQQKRLVDRVLLSIKVGLEMDVEVAKVRIPRHKPISPDQLEVKHQLITESYHQIVSPEDDISSYVTSRVIPAGAVILKKYLREPPVVWKESPVRVQIISGALVLETNGISKKDGMVGDRVHVLCPTTGKRLTGIVKSPDLVVVELH